MHGKFTKTVQTAHLCKENGCKGIVSVATLLGFHLLCLLINSILFIRHVRYSRQGNIWHAISQVTWDGLRETLKEGNDMDDGALARLMGEEGKRVFVRLQRHDDGGRINVVKILSESPDDAGRSWNRWLSKVPEVKMPETNKVA